jgi:hypothetical protein
MNTGAIKLAAGAPEPERLHFTSARGEFVYRQRIDGRTWSEILVDVNRLAKKRNWKRANDIDVLKHQYKRQIKLGHSPAPIGKPGAPKKGGAK